VQAVQTGCLALLVLSTGHGILVKKWSRSSHIFLQWQSKTVKEWERFGCESVCLQQPMLGVPAVGTTLQGFTITKSSCAHQGWKGQAQSCRYYLKKR
jgi:hypothetical protein